MSPLFHPVTQFNQGQPCRLHAQEVQPDTVEVHFGFESAPITPCNINCRVSSNYESPNTKDLDVTNSNAPAASPAAGNASGCDCGNCAYGGTPLRCEVCDVMIEPHSGYTNTQYGICDDCFGRVQS